MPAKGNRLTMATTKIWAIHSRLDHLVDYVGNPEKTANLMFDDLNSVLEYAGEEYKTEQHFFVSSINCQPETAYTAMGDALKMSDKKIKVLGYHAYQSFAKGEVSAQIAHEIGVKLAQELWGDKFQVVVATHLNTNHYHNHFVLCSTSFIDGKRFHSCKESYQTMREVSDRLCREYALSVIENPQYGRSKHYAEWRADQEGKPTWRSLIKKDVDEAVAQAMTDKQFFFFLRGQGYEIKMGKDISVKPPGKERFFRLARNFGEDYTLDGICRRILARTSRPKPPAQPIPQKQPTTIFHFKGDLKKAKRIGGLRGLYLHYCYKLGILPKGRPSPVRLHFLLREDLRKLDAITKETRLLCVNHIDALEQLLSFQAGLISEIETLTADRKHLRNQSRNITDKVKLSAIKADISALSNKLGKLRKEVKSCDNIAARSVEVREKLNRVRQDEISNGREDKRHEQFRGRS